MEKENFNMHYVCTLDEAEELINNNEDFWVSNCGCREKKGQCRQSKNDVCLSFITEFGGTGSNNRKVDRDYALNLIKLAADKFLVARPFRNPYDQQTTIGICFCCSDCCSYFLDEGEECDKGLFIEETEIEICIDCGACVEVCYFNARELVSGKLKIIRDNCYGCGLCPPVCPVKCIRMVKR